MGGCLPGGQLTFSLLADVVTLVSAVATGWVLWETFGLKGRMLNRARVPELRADLGRLSGDLLKAIQARNEEDIASSLAKIHSTLNSTSQRLSGENRRKVEVLIFSIESARQSIALESLTLRSLYAELMGVVEMLKNLEKDASWRP